MRLRRLRTYRYNKIFNRHRGHLRIHHGSVKSRVYIVIPTALQLSICENCVNFCLFFYSQLYSINVVVSKLILKDFHAFINGRCVMLEFATSCLYTPEFFDFIKKILSSFYKCFTTQICITGRLFRIHQLDDDISLRLRFCQTHLVGTTSNTVGVEFTRKREFFLYSTDFIDLWHYAREVRN